MDNRVKLKYGMWINTLLKTRLCKTNDLYTDCASANTQVKRSLNMTYKNRNLLFYIGF